MSWLLAPLLTGLATTVGALPFLWWSVSRRFYDTLLGLGAGLMLAAATLGLLATALADLHPGGHLDVARLGLVLGGFIAGVALLWTMDRVIPHVHAGGHHVHVHDDHVHAHGAHDDNEVDNPERARRQGLLVVGVMSLHRLPEGFAIGAAYAAGGPSQLGLTLAIAIAVQNAVEGAVMAAPLKRGGLGKLRLLLLVSATGMAVPLAAIAGWALSLRVAGALPPMLALGAGALLYLTCNEVIPESHSHGNEKRATFGVVGGFLIIILMQVLFGQSH